MKEDTGDGSQTQHHQHNVPEAPHITGVKLGVSGHTKESPGHQEDGDVADHSHGVPDGRQSRSLILTSSQTWYESQMTDLHTRPPKLEDASEGGVVDELSPLVRICAANTGHEDEGEADQDTNHPNQMPRLFLAIFSK